MTEAIKLLDVVWRKGMAPEPQLLVSEWADAHRILPPTAAEPGHWRTSRTPYLREIMDCLSVASPIERVVLMKSAQVGATEAALNFAGYVIVNAPGVLLYVMPTTESARRNVRLRVDPLIESSPIINALVVPAKSRDPGNTDSLKRFPGGQLSFTGANSGVGLRSTPARYVVCDEVDGFPTDVDAEGDPVSLAIMRTVTFRGRRKIFLLSTPTIEGVSRIQKAFEEGDQRRFFVPCPHCGTFQTLRWSQVRWPGEDRKRAFYTCEHCGEAIHERHKAAMVAQGEWGATAQGDGRTASFHISALYSPFVSWGEVAVEHGLAHKDPARLQTWVNCSLGECWEDRAAQLPEPARLMARAESWGDVAPDDVVCVTAGVDVQQDRLELEIVGWGRGEESWSLEYHALSGNPAEPDVWQRLDELLLRRRTHRVLGAVPVSATCVDSGHWSKMVYAFTGQRFHRRIFATKGSSDPSAPIWPRRPSKPKGRESALFITGSTAAKEITVSRLSLGEPGPGYMHFPARDLDWFSMLTAERPIRRFERGVAKRVWIKSPSARNEALDCRCYALAALHALRSYGFDLDREADSVSSLRGADTRAAKSARASITRSQWITGAER